MTYLHLLTWAIAASISRSSSNVTNPNPLLLPGSSRLCGIWTRFSRPNRIKQARKPSSVLAKLRLPMNNCDIGRQKRVNKAALTMARCDTICSEGGKARLDSYLISVTFIHQHLDVGDPCTCDVSFKGCCVNMACDRKARSAKWCASWR